MHIHGPNLLEGPVSRRRAWWTLSDDDIMEAMSQLPQHQEQPSQTKAPRRPPSDAPIRIELVERIRKEIAAGTYDTPERWDAALERLSRQLEGES
jgi:Anti-sigma-28 factor, FlgM